METDNCISNNNITYATQCIIIIHTNPLGYINYAGK